MKIKKIIYFIVILLILVVVSGCSSNKDTANNESNNNTNMTLSPKVYSNECEELSQKYEDMVSNDIGYNLMAMCESSPIPSVWVGGMLTNKSCQYVQGYNRTECVLSFETTNKKLGIFYNGEAVDIDVFKIGQFYKLDLSAECALRFSAASSGMFGMNYGKNVMPLNCSINTTQN